MQNLEQTIISQYATSARILALIEDFNTYVDPTYNFDQFYLNIWDIVTSNGYGLDVLGRIVGVSRVLTVASGMYFGFSQQAEAEPWSSLGSWFNPNYSGSLTNNVLLADAPYRVLIMAKSLLNLTNCSAPSVNAILTFLFVTNVAGRTGQAYCTDPGGMAMTYTFNGLNPPLTALELAIINQSGVLPRPSGVAVTVVQI